MTSKRGAVQKNADAQCRPLLMCVRFAPIRGIYLLKTSKDSNYIKIFTRLVKFELHASSFSLQEISVVSVYFTFSGFSVTLSVSQF
jgi:hypothetical protein